MGLALQCPCLMILLALTFFISKVEIEVHFFRVLFWARRWLRALLYDFTNLKASVLALLACAIMEAVLFVPPIIICSDIIMRNLQKNLANAKAHETRLRFKLRRARGQRAEELNGELAFTLAYIANVEAGLELERVIRNIQNRRSRAATKIQSVWRGSTERQRTRTMRGHNPQSPPR